MPGVQDEKIIKELRFLRELVQDIQIEIMDGRLNDSEKIKRICTWCWEYVDKYMLNIGGREKNESKL